MKRIAAVLMFSLLLAACGGQTGTTPPSETPPVERPPVEQPPVTTPPPSETPPTDGSEVELVEFIPYETDYSKRAVGMVRNTGAQNMAYLRITANFYDSSGQLVSTDFTYVDLNIVRPGEEAAFNMYLSDAVNNFDNYEVVASWRWTTEAAVRLEVIQATLQDDSYAQRLIGRVVNDDAVTRRFAQAVYVCYDDSGRLADAGSTYTDPTDLGAGQTGTFSTTIIGPRTEVASCDVIAQATNL